jgi:hypothetical protein
LSVVPGVFGPFVFSHLGLAKSVPGQPDHNHQRPCSDVAGNVYLSGTTTSTDLPVKNAAQTQNRGTLIIVSDDGGQTWSPTGNIPEIAVTAPVKLPLAAPVLLDPGRIRYLPEH